MTFANTAAATQVSSYINAKSGATATSLGTVVIVRDSAAKLQALFGSLAMPVAPKGLPVTPTAVIGSSGPVAKPSFAPPSSQLSGMNAQTLREATNLTRTNSTGSGQTVGILALSNWNQQDLITWAQDMGYSSANGAVLAPGAVNEVFIDGGPTNTPSSPSYAAGSYEVATDAQTVLAMAPLAHIRIYLAPNTVQGEMDAYAAMAADAQAGLITQATTSWGTCDPGGSGTPPLLGSAATSAITNSIATMNAANVTMVAASGDAGAYDCSTPQKPNNAIAVDFPAELPNVTAVGASTLIPNGQNWNQQVWGSSSVAFQSLAMESGLMSSGAMQIPLPSTWSGYASGGGFGPNGRVIPDLVTSGNPSFGMPVYTQSTGWVSAGGTSTSSPEFAAMLADMASSIGQTGGFGNINSAIHSHPQVFQKTVTGSNGTYYAAINDNPASGAGAPNWAAMADVLAPQPGSGYIPHNTFLFDTACGMTTPTGYTYPSCSLQTSVTAAPQGPQPGNVPIMFGINNLPINATAVQLNMTVMDSQQPGWGTVYPMEGLPGGTNAINYAGTYIPGYPLGGFGSKNPPANRQSLNMVVPVSNKDGTCNGSTCTDYVEMYLGTPGTPRVQMVLTGVFANGAGSNYVPLSGVRSVQTPYNSLISSWSNSKTGVTAVNNANVLNLGGIVPSNAWAVAANVSILGMQTCGYVNVGGSTTSSCTVSPDLNNPNISNFTIFPLLANFAPGTGLPSGSSQTRYAVYTVAYYANRAFHRGRIAGMKVDVYGYYLPPGQGGLQYHNAGPIRVLDTRVYSPAITEPFGPQNGTTTVNLPDTIPTNAQYAAIDLTTMNQSAWSANGSVSAPANTPTTSIQWNHQQPTSSMTLLPITNGPNGQRQVSFSTGGQTQYTADLVGYYS